MARLYVVNCTGQQRIINYRVDYTVDDQGRRMTERNRPYKSITIPARQQMQFGGDMPVPHMKEIVAQIERTCGAVHTHDIKTAKAKGVVKLVWNQDQPVPRAILEDVVQHNLGLLTEQGEERRRRLAIGSSLNMNSIADALGDGIPGSIVEFESVEDSEDADLPSPALAEGYKTPWGAGQDAPKPSRSRKPKAAAA